MHKPYLSFLLLLLGMICNLNAQTTFVNTYGGNGDDRALCVKQSLDGGFFIAGSTKSFGAGFYDAYLIKTDADGDTVWTKTYGGSNNEFIFSALQTSDGGYLLCGSNQSAYLNIYLLKTDANGDSLWVKSIGNIPGLTAEGYSVKQTTDGGYIIAGYVDSIVNSGVANLLLLKTDNAGNTQWAKNISGLSSNGQRGYDVCQTYDGGFAVVGHTNSSSKLLNALLIKVDTSGNCQWSKTFDALSRFDSGRSIQQTTDSGFIITGYTDVLATSGKDATLIKTNAAGDIQWAKLYGGTQTDEGTYVQQTADGGYIVCGSTQSFGVDNADAYLFKVNASGTVVWSRTYGGSGDDWASYIQQTSDNGFIMVGFSNSFGGGNNLLAVKTDANGNVCLAKNAAANSNDYPITVDSFAVRVTTLNAIFTTPDSTFTSSGSNVANYCPNVGMYETENDKHLHTYPNPANNTINIEMRMQQANTYSIHDLAGHTIQYGQINSKLLQVDIADLAKGVYLIQLQQNGRNVGISKVFKE